jgi:hypothetical protein
LEVDNMEPYDEKTVKELIEKYGKMSVREAMTTGSSNLAIPALVAARAGYYLSELPDVRVEDYCWIEEVPEGGGKSYTFQLITPPTYQTWTEGTAISPADLTLAKVTVTLAQYGQGTFLSDLLQDSSIYGFTEAIGRGHAEAVRKAINTVTLTALKAATDNVVTGGVKADATVYSPTFANIRAVRVKVVGDMFRPDVLFTGPVAWDAMLGANWTNVQVSGALIQYVTSGGVPRLLGMDVVESGVYGDGTGADGEVYMSMMVRNFALGWCQRGGIMSEIERNAKAIGQDIVTHIDAGTGLLVDKATGHIKHAA